MNRAPQRQLFPKLFGEQALAEFVGDGKLSLAQVFLYLLCPNLISVYLTLTMSDLLAQKQVEIVHPDNLPGALELPALSYYPVEQCTDSTADASHEHLLGALHKLVAETSPEHGGTHDVSKTIHTPIYTVASHPWLGKYIPGLETLAAKYHVGNFVFVRETCEKIFESMPICEYQDSAIYNKASDKLARRRRPYRNASFVLRKIGDTPAS